MYLKGRQAGRNQSLSLGAPRYVADAESRFPKASVCGAAAELQNLNSTEKSNTKFLLLFQHKNLPRTIFQDRETPSDNTTTLFLLFAMP